MSGFDTLVIVVYLVAVLCLGVFLSWKEGRDGFFVNNRKTRLFLLIFTALSTTVGSGTLIGVSAAVYTTGISFAISFMLLSAFGWGLVAYLAPRIKGWGDRLDAYTFGDFLAARFSPAVRTAGIPVVVITYFAVGAIQFVAIASLGEVMGIGYMQSLILATVVTATYTAFAGVKGDFYTDAIQFWVMLPIFLLLAYTGFQRLDFVDLFTKVPPEFLSPTNYAGPAFLIGSVVFGFGLILVSVESWQRIFAAVDARTARRAFAYSGILKIVAVFMAMIFGLMAYQLIPTGVPKDEALFTLMSELLPSGLLGVGFASILAILMSTIDSTLMVGSATVTKDIYLVKYPDASEKQVLLVGRLSVIVFAASAALVAFFVDDIVRLSVTSAQMLLVFLPALLGGLLWKRATSRAALWSIILGFLVVIIMLPISPDTGPLAGGLLGAIVFVILSFMNKQKPVTAS